MEVIVDCDGSHCGQWWESLLIVMDVTEDSGEAIVDICGSPSLTLVEVSVDNS